MSKPFVRVDLADKSPDFQRIALEPGVWVRVGMDEKRKITTGDEPARVLAVGGSPDRAYVPPEFTEEGGGISELKAELHGL